MKFEDLGLDVRGEEVWIIVLGEELGGLEGNESGFVTSSSNGSGYGETEKKRRRKFNKNESCFICLGGFQMAHYTIWKQWLWSQLVVFPDKDHSF